MSGKVIFLDMDGVLCTARAHAAYSDGTSLWRHLDPIAVKLVEKLCKEFDAALVLSSTWREYFDQNAMTSILSVSGFAKVPWHQNWKTPSVYSESRGREIALWLDANRGHSYLILDDDVDMAPEQKPFFVQTHTDDGFLFDQYLAAREILGKAPKC